MMPSHSVGSTLGTSSKGTPVRMPLPCCLWLCQEVTEQGESPKGFRKGLNKQTECSHVPNAGKQWEWLS